ncbi:MAG: hypothetical protein COB15_14590 [Flavobacteriales bacterium]|nr:MAG: hypothetical protein COB15_14590 [Flavobacteriales bacterium]
MKSNNSEIIYNLFNTLNKEKIICAYHGDFNYKVVNGLLESTKKDLSHPEHNIFSAKKTYNVLVECLENIHKHSTKNNETTEGIFILSNPSTGFNITVGNLIHNDYVEILKSKIDTVNKLSRDQLKENYRKIILKTEISPKGGAGLGITDIALKSGAKLNYNFHEYDETSKFFTLSIHIKNK